MATWHPQFVQPFLTSALDADDRSASCLWPPTPSKGALPSTAQIIGPPS